MISRTHIEEAASRIAGYVRTTPVMVLPEGAWGVPAQVVLKLEQLQHSGSFKARGAFHRILSQNIPPAGVIAASGGNHGAAVAYAARQLGYQAEIFVPETSSPVKIARLRSYGANIHLVHGAIADALQACQERAEETGALFIHPYDQDDVILGQGTLARELDLQVPDLDTVLVAVGGGGLIAGISRWFEKRIKVVGVEPTTIRSLHDSLEAGHLVDVEVSGVAADSLGARRAGIRALEITQQYADGVVLVTDEQIVKAQQYLWEEYRQISEPGGATAAAALLYGAYTPAKGERVGVILCGANTTLQTFL